MKTCSCEDHGEIKAGVAVIICADCKGVKPANPHEGKVIATRIDGSLMIFDSKEDYDKHQAKVMAEIFDNAFTNNYKDEAPTD